MSVCLGVTKAIAVSSLGLYAGILTASTVITHSTPIDVLLHRSGENGSQNDDTIMSYFKSIVCNVGKISTFLGSLATAFFGASYFGAPPSLRHPYLLYGMSVVPASIVYLYLLSKFKHRKSGCCAKLCGGASKSASPSLGESAVDLGKDFKHPKIDPKDSSAKCPFGTTMTNPEAKKNCNASIVTHLSLVTVFTIAGFVQAVFGVYGEGLFV